MLKKIISGGQTGADRAALDVAIKFNIPHGGWISRGRKTEAGPLPERYRLREILEADYPARTKRNIMDSQGTAIISRGKLTGGSLLTQSFARVKGKPNVHIDLSMNEAFEASLVLQSFILENGIEVLNLAGPRASHDPGIYFDVKTILESVLYMLFLDFEGERRIRLDLPKRVKQVDFPEKMEDAVSIVIQDLSLRARTYIARMEEARLQDLYFIWLEYIRRRVGFDNGNQALLKACQKELDLEFFSIEDGVMEILKAVKMNLEPAYRLKVVK
ncbi:putative molybdenum carrier protein [Desulfospira joergensenii]|uniref:putative molybdenum carrier protein n=1 Tax=Desulfospira joergensenii TaxID=53329 RepID=UPI001FC95E2E|nr:putative molybdenum carrier protein [Desulfospira joergensenii]